MSAQYANPALTPAKLLAVNVNGLAGEPRRKAFLQFVMDSAWDVLVLSETHCGDLDVARQWLKEGAGPGKPWLGGHFWALGTSASRGVAILLRYGFATSAKMEYEGTGEAAGRLLRVDWARGPGLRPASVLAVYAPSDGPASRLKFFSNGGPLHQALMAGGGVAADLFVGGDFNCRLPGPGGAVNTVSADVQQLQSLLSSAGLVDVWASVSAGPSRPQPRAEDSWTYSHPSSGGARLDYWFAPHHLVSAGWATRCVHRWDAASPGDHAAVDLAWACPGATARAASRWRFPDSLLKDASFVPDACHTIKLFVQQWQPATPAEHAAPARCRWDAVKRCLKHLAIKHMYALSQQRRQELRQAAEAERQARAAAAHALPGQASAAHQQWRKAAEQLAQLSARQSRAASGQPVPEDVLWDTYGEQSTKWFFQLMPRDPGDPALAGGITAVNVPGPDGQLVRRSVHDSGGVAAVGDALSAFFDGSAGGLFAPGAVSIADQDLLLDAVDRTVPAAEAQRCLGPTADGTVTAICLQQALAGTAGGKVPGGDGLTYEVYKAFWEVLGQPLADCFNEAFADAAAGACLSRTQCQGIITLLHKGGNKPADEIASYRPITLLNSDVKLLARVLVGRMAPALECVIDQTQTAFLPGRWIGDNVLFHLEEVDYCTAEHVPGCVLFLDFEKAYDRLDRGWLFRCVERLGFPPQISRWVRLLLEGSVAGVHYHGFVSPWVPVRSGVAQGSPASPPLYLIAAQPLAARLRKLQAQGVVDAIQLPDGTAAPPCHQHADDTTLHTQSTAGALKALHEAVQPFSRASNARLNVSKSHGLLLGCTEAAAAAAAVLAEAHTGVPFVAPDQHLRHLGVLLSVGNPVGACEAMFEKRRAGVLFRVRSWARFDLSYLGRLYVAKQVLASSLYYHATFVPPPEAKLNQIEACISNFVLFGRVVEPGEPGGVQRSFPSSAVESLPYELGGLRRADIPAQVMALHGKVAAMLLHPRRHPWKVLMRRSFERAHPALGPAVLVSQVRPIGAPNRSVRLLAYWKALAALAPSRMVQPDQLSAHHVCVERLVQNAQVVGASCTLAGVTDVKYLPVALQRSPGFQPTLGALRDVLAAGHAGPARAGALKVAGQVVPAAWRSVLAAPQLPQALWWVSACGQWLVCSDQARNPPGAFSVRPDGRVAPAPGGLPPELDQADGPSFWRAACVVWCPVLKGQELLVSLRPDPHLEGLDAFPVDEHTKLCELQPWVLGEWASGVWVDPNVWGLGSEPLSAYVVRQAAARLILLGLCRTAPDFQPAEGIRPKLFAAHGRPDTGLGPMVAGQEQLFAQRWRALAEGRDGSQRRVRRRLPVDEHGRCPLYEASWMRESVDRAHPLERTLARQGAVAEAGGGQARRDDCRDPLSAYTDDRPRAWQAPPPEPGRLPEPPPWKQVFEDLKRLKRLDRRLRFFGWTLAHGALRCGGVMLSWNRPGGQDVAGDAAAFVEVCGCSAECCAHGQRPPGEPPPCETLVHVLVHCPVVRPALQWLCRLCQRALGQAPPQDRIADIIVTGAKTLWKPPGNDDAPWDLWTHLRLQYCSAVWQLTTRRNRTGQAFDAAAVVAVAAAALERAVRHDWLKVWVGGGFEDMPSWCGLGLKRVQLQPDVFRDRWLKGGVLAHLEAEGGQGALRVHVPRALDDQASGS